MLEQIIRVNEYLLDAKIADTNGLLFRQICLLEMDAQSI